MKKVFLIFLIGLSLSWTMQVIELEKRLIFDDKIEILVPKEFKIMSEEMLKLKYPSERRPTLVYTNEGGSINLAFNHTTSKATQQLIESYKETFVSTFKNLYPSADWKGSGTVDINGKQVGYLKLITPAIDTKIYNCVFFTDFEGRLLICSFNCLESDQKEWTAVSEQIMNSLKIK